MTNDIPVTTQTSLFDQIAQRWLAPLRLLYPVSNSYVTREDRVFTPGSNQANDPRGSQTGFWNMFPNESLNMGGTIVGGSNYNVQQMSTPMLIGIVIAVVLATLYILKK